ncbi:MAG: hypothetical protein HOQ44_18195 [Nocardia sp.]|nr:hypothetical protein [Nocardia sp.]
MPGLIRFVRDFAYGVHAGHGIRHGVPRSGAVRGCRPVGDDARGRVGPVRADPAGSGQLPAVAGGLPA